MRNNSYERYLLNELETLREDNKGLRSKLRKEIGDNLYKQEELEKLRFINIELSNKINRLEEGED